MVIAGVAFGAALFVLALLVVLAKFGQQVAAKHYGEFRKIVLGAGLFGMVTVLHLAKATGATALVPFLSQPPFLEVVAAIAAITGVVLLASGASILLPANRGTGATEERWQVNGQVRHRESEAVVRRLQGLMSLETPISDSFVAIARLLKESLGGQLCSLTVEYSGHDVRRYTVGENDTLLTEKLLDAPTAVGVDAKGGGMASPVVTGEIERFMEPGAAVMLREQGFVSVLLIPFGSGEYRSGYLLLAGKSADLFGKREVEVAHWLQAVLAAAIATERQRVRFGERLRQTDAIGRLARKSAEHTADIDELFAESAAVLRKATGAAVARIALLEDDGDFLHSRALSAATPTGKAVPANGYLVSSIMPLHQQVREAGQTVLIKQADANAPVTTAEAQQVFQGDITAMLLCPIKAGRDILGIITLADHRSEERFRFTEEDQWFAGSVAAILAQAVRLHETPWGALASRDRSDADKVARRYEERRQIRSSLTGILGSVEMLRTHPTGQEAERFVQIIDRSARRIETFLTEKESVH